MAWTERTDTKHRKRRKEPRDRLTKRKQMDNFREQMDILRIKESTQPKIRKGWSEQNLGRQTRMFRSTMIGEIVKYWRGLREEHKIENLNPAGCRALALSLMTPL